MTSEVFTTSIFDIKKEREQLASIHLRVRRGEENNFIAEIHAGDYHNEWTFRMSDADLEDINKEFQDAAEASIADVEDWVALPDDEVQSLIRPLAKQGHSAYLWVFQDDEVRSKLEELLARHKRSRVPITIQVVSESLFLPWELIYPPSAKNNVDVFLKNFWGLNYIIYRIIPPWYLPPTTIGVEARIKIGLLTDTSLHFVKNKEIPFFEKLNDTGRISLIKLEELCLDRVVEGFSKFEIFWGNDFNIAHFACHAEYVGGPNKSKFTLTNDFPISLQDMDDLTINGKPLIFMNACESGTLNPLYTKSFASYFIQRGAVGVVATECVIPDQFAAAFAERLYTLLLKKQKQLGESLLATRKYFYKKGNPTGLLYSMYAPPSIRVSVQEDLNEQTTKNSRR